MKSVGIAAALSVLLLVATGCSHKCLLLVTQYSDDSPRVARMKEAIAGRFKAAGIAHDLFVFNMDTRGRPTDIWREEMGHMAVVRVDAFDPDVVFVAGDDAARYFAQRLVNRPWRFVFFDVKGDPSEYLFTVSTNVTGVRELVPVREMFDLIKALLPKARRVGIIADRSLEGDAVVKQVLAARDADLSVAEVIRAGTLDEWLEGVRRLQTGADVLIIASCGSVLSEPNGERAVPEAELLRRTASVNQLPDFSFSHDAARVGSVLAAVTVPIAAQADLAAEMGVRAVGYGADVFDIRITSSRARARTISMDRARQLGIAVPPAFLKPFPTVERRKRGLLEKFGGFFKRKHRPHAM